MEREKEPGTARYGNFINYYSFNPPEKRISLLPDPSVILNHLMTSQINTGQTISNGERDRKISENVEENMPHEKDRLVVLDVGCNAGDLTIAAYRYFTSGLQNRHLEKEQSDTEEIYLKFQELRMIGIDMDEKLIERCVLNNPFPNEIDFVVSDITDTDHRHLIKQQLMKNNKDTFDLSLCFSVTMWIHLNHGDEGLKEFLSYISRISRFLIIEPQPWKCYRSAMRRMKKVDCEPFKHFENLQWRNNVDEDILTFLTTDCHMKLVDRFGKTSWERSVCLLKHS